MSARKEKRDLMASQNYFNEKMDEPCGLTRRSFSEYRTQTENRILELEAQVKNDLSNLTELKRAQCLISRQRAQIKCYQEGQKILINHGNGILKMLSRFMPVPFWAWSFDLKREI